MDLKDVKITQMPLAMVALSFLRKLSYSQKLSMAYFLLVVTYMHLGVNFTRQLYFLKKMHNSLHFSADDKINVHIYHFTLKFHG